MISITIVANTGNVKDLTYLPSGTAVLNFSVAVNRRWKNNEGETQEETTWFDAAIFGKYAEAIAPHLKKGDKVAIHTDRIESRAWTTKDGELASGLSIVVRNLELLGSSNGGGNNNQSAPAPQEEPDEIPF